MSKKALQDLIQKIQNKQWQDGQAKDLMSSIQKEQTGALKPVLEEMAKTMAGKMAEEFTNAAKQIKVDSPAINMPEMKMPEMPPIEMPEIKVPQPKVTVNVPDISVPPMKWPDGNMPIEGWVQLMGVDLRHPLPVQLRDAEGKPVSLNAISQVIGGGGKADFFTIKGFNQSAFSEILNPDGRVKVEPFAVSISGITNSIAAALVDADGVSYNGSNPLPVSATMTLSLATNQGDTEGRTLRVVHAGDTGLTTNITQVGGNAVVVGTGYQDNALRVVHATDAIVSVRVDSSSASTAASLIDSSGVQYSGSNPVPVNWVSGVGNGGTTVSYIVDSGGVGYNGSNPFPFTLAASHATNTMNAVLVDSGGIGYNGSNPIPTTLAVSNATSSLNARVIDSGGIGYDGSNPFPVRFVTGSYGTSAVNIVDSSGVAYEGANPFPIMQAGGTVNSLAATLIDSSGIGYSGSNPLPITGNVNVNGSLNSVIVVGTTLHHSPDDGDAPQKMGGIAMTANPTAVDAGDRVAFRADDLGRQLVRNVQVRDLIATAYVSKLTGSTFGTETTLFASGSGLFADLVMITASNDSTAAITMDLRASTGGTVCHSIVIPAGGMNGWTPTVPYPAPFVDHTWTIDLPDVTGTNVYVSALFSKEV